MFVSSDNAALLIGVSDETIRNYADDGRLSCKRVGVRRFYRLDVDSLRALATELNYSFDEELLAELIDTGKVYQ